MPSIIPQPVDERERLAALHALHLLDTPPEERFDRLIRITRQKLNVPIALISLVDTNRQWFKACEGLTVSETPRDISFCTYTIMQDNVMVIPDAKKDERFAENRLVIGPPFIRFYAGYPLRGPNGHKIGTLCIIDLMPRTINDKQIQILTNLGQLVTTEVNKTVSQKRPDTTTIPPLPG